MDWHRDVDYKLRLVDKERWINKDLGSGRGARPAIWIREDRNGSSSREAPQGLPRVLYDVDWVESLTRYEFQKMHISDEEFHWIRIQRGTT